MNSLTIKQRKFFFTSVTQKLNSFAPDYGLCLRAVLMLLSRKPVKFAPFPPQFAMAVLAAFLSGAIEGTSITSNLFLNLILQLIS